MTAYGSEEVKEEAYQRGAGFYYTKPIDIDALLQRVGEMGIPVKR